MVTNRIGFENDEFFQLGIVALPRYVIYPNYLPVETAPYFWQRGGYGFTLAPTYAKCEPETNIVHSGIRSAKMVMVNASLASPRIEVLRDINPLSDIHVWNEAWYYIPQSTADMVTSATGGITMHRLIYERLWDETLPMGYQNRSISLGIYRDGRYVTRDQLMFIFHVGPSDLDNDDDGADDMQGRDFQLYSNGGGSPDVGIEPINEILVPVGRWFKIRTYVYRNLLDFENGILRVWIDDLPIWDMSGTRTIGITPSRLAERPSYPPEPYAFLSHGFSHYTPERQLDGSLFYVDDITLSTDQFFPEPTPIPPLAVALALGIPAVALILWSILKR